MKFTAFLFAAIPAATSAWTTFSIANGLPIRRSVAKFNDDKVPEDAVTKAAEGKLQIVCSPFILNTVCYTVKISDGNVIMCYHYTNLVFEPFGRKHLAGRSRL